MDFLLGLMKNILNCIVRKNFAFGALKSQSLDFFFFFFGTHLDQQLSERKCYINIYTLIFSFQLNIYLSDMYSSAFTQAVRCEKLAFAFTDSSVGKRSICV